MSTQSDNGKIETLTPVSTSESGDAGEPRRGCGNRGNEGGCGTRRGRCGRKVLAVLAIVLVAGLAGSYIGKSWAQGGPHFFGMHRTALSGDPARMDERVDRMVRHFAVETDATPEQQQKLSTIAKAAAKDIVPMREQLKKARGQAVELLKAPNVDRAAIERLRSEQLQLADTVSKRITLAMGDVAEVLSPQQRQKIAGRLEQWMQRSDRMGHGWQGRDGMDRTPGTPAAPASAKAA